MIGIFKRKRADQTLSEGSAVAIFFDPFYFIFVLIPTIAISAGVQLWLRSTYSRWSQVPNHAGITGLQVGQAIFGRTSLQPIALQTTPGELTDHFDPSANVVRLSQAVAATPSVASMAVTAHELGHVQQHQTGSGLMKLRSALVPALRFSPTLSYICILLGLIMGIAGLFYLGILFFGLMVIFTIMTVPVEFDASRRAFNLLDQAGLLVDESDRRGARSMLNAAGFTYVAAAVTSILQLLYYISLSRR